MQKPAVSVAIPTYNRLDGLRRLLGALSRQTLSPAQFEVVVVSDGATDGTDRYLRSVSTPFSLIFAPQTNAGPAAARNRALRLASADLILFLDDDVAPAPDLIEQHVLSHNTMGVGTIVIGPMLTPPSHSLSACARWEQRMLYKQYSDMATGVYAPTYRQFFTGNASISRTFLLQTGGFDERFRRAEDVELAFRLAQQGARFVFNPSAVVFHHVERSFRAWLHNARDYGRNDVIFARESSSPARIDLITREFAQRNLLTRSVARSCIGRPLAIEALQRLVRAAIPLTERAGLGALSMMLLSSLYNAMYYSSVAEELGGRHAFFALAPGSGSERTPSGRNQALAGARRPRGSDRPARATTISDGAVEPSWRGGEG